MKISNYKYYFAVVSVLLLAPILSLAQTRQKSLHNQNIQFSDKKSSTLNNTSNAASASSTRWKFRLNPYIWILAADGNFKTENVKSSMGEDLGEAFTEPNGAIGIDLEARGNDWGLLSQFVYTVIQDTDSEVPGAIYDAAEDEFEHISFTQYLSLPMVEGENGYWDFLVGGRLVSISNDLKLRGGPEDRRRYQEDNAWVDPVVGYNLRLYLTEETFIHSTADIGGFDTSSELTWQAMAEIGFLMSRKASIAFGYKALSHDYEKNTFEYDVIMHGVTAKLDVKF